MLTQLSRPKVISIDTSVWGKLSVRWKDNPLTRRLLRVLETGKVIPLLTLHHLEELFQHESAESVRERAELLRRVPFVFYPTDKTGCVGGVLEIRDAEIMHAFRKSEGDPTERIRTDVLSGFTSGKDLWDRTEEVCEYFQRTARTRIKDNAETASLVHAEILPDETALPEGKANLHVESLERHYHNLALQVGEIIRKNGDHRIRSESHRISSSFMGEAHSEAMQAVLQGKDIRIDILERAGIAPFKPVPRTLGELRQRVVFAGWLIVHSRRLLLPPLEVQASVRPDMIPTWRIWSSIERIGKKQMQYAAASDFNDRMLAGFLPYVDGVQLDKRIRECLRQAAKADSLTSAVFGRVLPASSEKLISLMESWCHN